MMKKISSLFLLLCMLLSLLALPVSAEDSSQTYAFELSVDGKAEKQVSTGDLITVMLTLKRTDADADYTMYAMQDEILYDSSFFELVEGSEMTSGSITTRDLAMRDQNTHAFYMNFVSLTGGASWKAETLIGSFQLKVIGESGSSVIRNSNHQVSLPDGSDSYAATTQDVTVTVSQECRVRFVTNCDTSLPDQTVALGGKIERPEDPEKEGYYLEGWYRDIDLQGEAWDFSQDKVEGNMTLYAGWAEGTAPAASSLISPLIWVLLGILLLLVILFLLFFLGKKTVRFDARGGSPVAGCRVKRGSKISQPSIPVKEGSLFQAWYKDEECTKPWDFQKDTVDHNLTLYAGWDQ